MPHSLARWESDRFLMNDAPVLPADAELLPSLLVLVDMLLPVEALLV